MPRTTETIPGIATASREDLENLVCRWVEKGKVAADHAGYELESIRSLTKEGALAVSETADQLSPVERELLFMRYYPQLAKLDGPTRSRISWKNLQKRLVADNARYLKLAADMLGGGLLIGVDKEGNPLFADAGNELGFRGMTYHDARNRVLYKHSGTQMIMCDGEPVSTGYELFKPAKQSVINMHDHKRRRFNIVSKEMKQYEAAAGTKFVLSERGGFAGSWLESGAKPVLPQVAECAAGGSHVVIRRWDSGDHTPNIGVRRLLRVKKV
jgi:hypothetical protein